jgi:hypothetical protein
VIKRIRQLSKLTLKKRYEKMFQKNFNKPGLTAIAMAAAIAYAPASNAALANYAEDFESLDSSSQFALALTGWGRYTSAWLGQVGPPGLFLYDYQGAAANATSGIGQMSAVATGEGGPAQGAQYLNVFSDYGNADHGAGALIDVNIFQQWTVGAADIGQVFTLTFDAKAPFTGGIAPPTTAKAFIKTLDPGAGYATTNDINVDMSAPSNTDWAGFSLAIDLSDPLLEGQLLQIGFNNTATAYNPSGVYYDNICFDNTGGCATPAVPVPAAVWLFGSGLLGLVGVARRRKS